MKLLSILAALALLIVRGGAQAPPDAYLDAARLDSDLKRLAAWGQPSRVRLEPVGTSREGRPIVALRVGDLDRPALDGLPATLAARGAHRPAILLVSGLESDILVGSAVLMHLVATWLDLPEEEFARRFADHDLLILPRVDLDGSERYFRKGARCDLPGAAGSIDQDRDGRDADEDQPLDLDADGLILEMRWPDPEGTFITDEKDPRLLVAADAQHRGRYLRNIEGRDQDGDGEFAEDPAVGVQLDRNFPQGFVEHDLASGPHPMSEPETRALADFVLARPEIAVVVVFGGHDNLAEIPAAESKPPARREPRRAPTAADRKLLEQVAALLAQEGKPFKARDRAAPGSFHDWCYYQLGLPSFAICLFEAQAGESPKAAATSQPNEIGPVSRPAEDALQLEAERVHREAFRPWTAFDHPQLGPVEIGGFEPYVRRNPAATFIAMIAARQERFLAALAAQLPRLGIADLRVTATGPGLYEIELDVVNDGTMPSTTEQAETCRVPLPLQLVLDLPRDRVLQGQVRETLAALPARVGRHAARWLIRGRQGERLAILLAPAHGPLLREEVVLP
ncbi:MAG: hypothetical protein H6807_01450 [Planctomycetes bacterium]|nr:hypothetical protein [Planctomycetota bacterium]